MPFALGAVFVVCLVLFLSGMSTAGDRSEEIIARSRPTTGEVLEFTDKAARDLRVADVRYEVGGKKRQAEVVILDPEVKRGERVPLRYDPSDPGVVFSEGDRQPPGGEIGAWVAVAFAGAAISGIGAVFAAIPRKPPHRIGE